jgi:hypothetical protein
VSDALGGIEVHPLTSDASPGFFHTLELPLLLGRDFTWQDNSRAPRVAIMSQSLARALYGRENPIGRRLRVGHVGRRVGDPREPEREVVGVVADAKLYDFWHPTNLILYTPLLQDVEGGGSNVIIRTDMVSGALLTQVRQAVASLGHEFAWRGRTLEQRTDDDLNTEWLVAEIAAAYSTVALVLTAIGVYALLAYLVTTRQKELGIRLALGAEPRRLVAFVVAADVKIALIGLGVGLGAVAIVNRWLASRLIGVGAFDYFSVVGSPLLLLAVALLACAAPAMRAARLDPIATLRAD